MQEEHAGLLKGLGLGFSQTHEGKAEPEVYWLPHAPRNMPESCVTRHSRGDGTACICSLVRTTALPRRPHAAAFLFSPSQSGIALSRGGAAGGVLCWTARAHRMHSAGPHEPPGHYVRTALCTVRCTAQGDAGCGLESVLFGVYNPDSNGPRALCPPSINAAFGPGEAAWFSGRQTATPTRGYS